MFENLSDANEGWILQAQERIQSEIAQILLHALTPELDDQFCGRIRFHLTELRRKLYPAPHETPNVRIVEASPPVWHDDSFIENPALARSGHFYVELFAHPVVASQWRRLGVNVQDAPPF